MNSSTRRSPRVASLIRVSREDQSPPTLAERFKLLGQSDSLSKGETILDTGNKSEGKFYFQGDVAVAVDGRRDFDFHTDILIFVRGHRDIVDTAGSPRLELCLGDGNFVTHHEFDIFAVDAPEIGS